MFPKHLRVVTDSGEIERVQINETHSVEKTVPFIDQLQDLNVIADALGFSYEFVFPSEEEGYGWRLPNGSWTGALGMIQRGEADLIFGGLPVDEELHEYFSVSYPFTIEEVTFMTRKHQHVTNPMVFLHPFSIQVWLSIIGFLFLIHFAFHYLLRRKHSAVNLIKSTLGSLVGQGMDLMPQKPREYFVLASWILGSAFLYYFYTAVLLSFITFPSLQAIRTIEDLAKGIKDGKYKIATTKYAVPELYFRKSENAAVRAIGNYFDRRSEVERTDNFIEFLEMSAGVEIPAFIGVRSQFLPYKDFYFISEETFYFEFSAFVTHKKFCCRLELDKAVHRIWSSGIYEKNLLGYDYYYFLMDLEKYGKYWENTSSEGQLTLTLLKGLFIFLIASHCLSFLVFLFEVCIGKLKQVVENCFVTSYSHFRRY